MISFRNVDLPAPFGPSSPVMPGGTATVTSFRPETWPYHLERCSVVTMRRAHATTSTPRTRRSSTESDTATSAASTITDTGSGVA